MATPTLDVATYAHMPRLDVPSSISLAKRLLLGVPRHASPPLRASARKMHGALTTLEAAWKRSDDATVSETDVRPLDKHLDNLWTAVRDRLAAYDALPEGTPSRIKAAATLATVLPDGLAFVKLPYLAEHAESQKRLDLIETRHLGHTLDALVGAEFIAALHAAHVAYGNALGITQRRDAPPATTAAVAEPLHALASAMGAYALQVLAFGAQDDANVPAAAQALAPIDEFRAAARHAGHALPPDAPPATAPIPPAPDAHT